jgi:hypothetical protein
MRASMSASSIWPAAASPRRAAQALRAHAPATRRFADAPMPAAQPWAMVIDGLFGIGLGSVRWRGAARPGDGDQRLRCPVLALDVPSGLDADTGAVIGPDGVAVRATPHDHLHRRQARACTPAEGATMRATCMVASWASTRPVPGRHLHVGAPALLPASLAPRRHDSAQGQFRRRGRGRRRAWHGGRAVLAARAALYSGAGRVFAAIDAGAGAGPDRCSRN